MLPNRRRYLDPMNFATNFAFFRDDGGHHPRLVTANYWAGYGGLGAGLCSRLLGGVGWVLAVVPAPSLLESAVVVRSALLGQRKSNMVGFGGPARWGDHGFRGLEDQPPGDRRD